MKLIYTIFFIFILLVISGCSMNKPAPRVERYIFEYDPPKIISPVLLPHVIRVDRFNVSPSYDSDHMIFKEDKYKRDLYIYHRWHTNPGEMVANFLARDIEANNLFKAVFRFDKSLPATHIISGVVEEIFEYDQADKWEAILCLTITLINAKEPNIAKSIIFQKQYISRKRCVQKTPHSLANAMSLAMEEISGQVMRDVYSRIKG